MRRFVAALIVLAALATTTAEAQKPAPGRNARQGFWIGFGFGPGSVGFDCASCGSDRTTGGSGYLRLGGTISQSFLLGFEANGWAKSEGGVDDVVATGFLMAHWYPSRNGALYIKFGIGGMSWVSEDATDELAATAGAAIIGVGYEIRLTRNMSLTPFLNSMASGNAEFELNGQPVTGAADFKMNMVQAGLGLTWH